MPYPSAGCQTCKARRIKCDETKPICQRCVKSRRVCLDPSAVKQVGLSIHLENPYASGEIKRPRGPRPRSTLTLARLTSDVPSLALAYYLNYYLYELAELPTVSACMSECLTEWQVSKRQCSMVDLAVSAVALAIFSRIHQHPSAARAAFIRYNSLIRVAQEQITQVGILRCDERRFDEFLLSVVLMAMFETTMHQPANLEPKNWPISLHSWSHHDGAMAILEAWNNKPRDHAPSNVIKQSRRGLIRSALLRNRSLPDWVRDGRHFGEHGLDLGFDCILVRAVNLRHTFKHFKRNQQLGTAEANDLNNDARRLDEACREWAVQVPREWSYKSYRIPSSWPRRDFYSSVVRICAMHGYAAVWIQYFAVRMLINSTLLSLPQLSCSPQLQVQDSTIQPQRRECTTQLKDMTDRLASMIPFSLGQFKARKADSLDSLPALTLEAGKQIPPAFALPTIWPLSVASSLDGVEPSQQLWFRAELTRLGRILGDGALMCAETDEWTHN